MTDKLLEKENIPVAAGEDDISQYLREIREYPLLSAEEEVALAKRCAAGDKEAIRILTVSNLRLVVKLAREFTGRGVPLTDLIQEGSTGLLHAAEKFDYTKNCRFSTYATKWIRQSIDRYVLNHAGIIHLPRQKMEKIRKLLAIRIALKQEQEEEPTVEQIAQRSGETMETVTALLDMLPKVRSLNSPAGEDDDGSIEALIENLQAPQPQEEILKKELQTIIQVLLQTLDERQRQILRLRFGMEDGVYHSLSSVGLILDISKERARQLEQKALDQLQKLGTEQGLEEFLE